MSDYSLLPPSASDFMRCVERGSERLNQLPVHLNMLWDPDSCPPALLPYLAWALSVDRWDMNWPEETKRSVIRSAWLVHRQKGTVAAIRRVVEPFGELLKVSEWWETSEEPGTFRIEIGLRDQGITDEAWQEMVRLVDDAKPVSRHLAGLTLVLQIPGAQYVAGAAMDGESTTVTLLTTPVDTEPGKICHGCAIVIADSLTISPATTSVTCSGAAINVASSITTTEETRVFS
ncbi:phage tail protein I [Escherichia coli]|uniref:phage tail protein I n=1 Tax=Escherichia coli TaxID=562 RepID=UPI001BD4973C|nr:phage tail protein I [Escherichia coli]MCF7296462.1 phage tail protein I [Escherichia coli]QVT90240.1 phage tail protein I [Escherichia coli]